jgi:hypothetical protein
MVHSVLSEEGSKYMDRFSKIFERHVVAQAQRVAATFYGESDLRSILGSNSKVPDGLLSFDGCNVFLESKAGLFYEFVMSLGHNRFFADRLAMIREAIKQAWEAAVGMQRSQRAPIPVRLAQNNYLIVVTNKEVSASRGTNFAAMLPTGALDYPSEEARALLPLEHIYVVNVDDYERLIAEAAIVDGSLPDFLAECVTCDSDSTTSCFYFSQHLDRMGLSGASPLVSDAFDAAMKRLTGALGG